MKGIYLLLGSNRGQRLIYLEKALDLVRQRAGIIVCHSSVYETAPWGFSDPVNFLNMAVNLDTELEPRELLYVLHQAEQEMGRVDKGRRFQPRIIDIDILLFGSLVVEEKDLTIPHPQLPVRRFALVPLQEIAPDIIHPQLHVNIGSLLERCEDDGEVRLFTVLNLDYSSPSSAKLK